MSNSNLTQDFYDVLKTNLGSSPSIDPDALILYSRIGQLEMWLRRIVRVEFMAKYGLDWMDALKETLKRQKNRVSYENSPEYNQSALQPQQSLLEYISFGSLTDILDDPVNRDIFEWMLNPTTSKQSGKTIDQTIAFLKDIEPVRNRIAHFRQLIPNDLNNVMSSLTKLEHVIVAFCRSFTDGFNNVDREVPSQIDPILSAFAYLNTDLAQRDETQRFSAYRGYIYLGVGVTRRPWKGKDWDDLGLRDQFKVLGKEGYVYSVVLYMDEPHLVINYAKYLDKISTYFNHIVLCQLGYGHRRIRILLPSTLSFELVHEMIEYFVHTVHMTRRPDTTNIEDAPTNERDLLDEMNLRSLCDTNPLIIIKDGDAMSDFEGDDGVVRVPPIFTSRWW